MLCVTANCFTGKYMQSLYNSKALDHKDKIFKFLTTEEALNIKL